MKKAKKKKKSTCRGFEPGAFGLSAKRYTDWATQAFILKLGEITYLNSDGFYHFAHPRVSAKVFAFPGLQTSLPSHWHQKLFYDSNW